MSEHTCHWPTCTTPVPPRLWGCREHWFKLPKDIRDAIWNAYEVGQEVRKDPSAAYLEAVFRAEKWAKAEIKAGREK